MSHAQELNPMPTSTVTSGATGQPVQVLKSKTVMKGSLNKWNLLPTQSSLGTIFSTGSSVIFDLRGQSVAFIKKIYFAITCANTDGSNAATLVNLPFLIQQIALFANGSDSTANLYPESDWFLHMPSLDQEKTTALAAVQNWSPTTYTSSGNTIPANGSATYWFELNCMINQSGIPVHESVSKPWRFQIYPTTNPLASTSAMTNVSHLNVTNFQMYINGEELSSAGLKSLKSAMKSMDHEFHCYTPQRQILAQGTLASGAQISSALTGFDGTFSSLTCFIRLANAAASATPEAQYQFVYGTSTPSLWALTNISLLKSDGSPIWLNNLPEQLARLLMSRNYYDTTFFNTFYAYNFDFNDHPVASNEDGKIGHIRVQTNWQLQAQSVSSGGSNTELVILGQRYTTIVVSPSGNVSVRFH